MVQKYPSIDDIGTDTLSCAIVKDISVVTWQLVRETTKTPRSRGLVHMVEFLHPDVRLYLIDLF